MFADYIGSLREAAEGDPRISFAGAYGASDVAAVFSEMDALLVPSLWYENTPFVVLEAFAAGVPVIASDLGGLSEVVREGQNGALFVAGDPRSMAEAIERILARPHWFQDSDLDGVASNADSYMRFRSAYAGIL